MIAIVPWSVDVPMTRWPWANCGLLAVTIAVSLYGFYDERLYFYLGGVEPPAFFLEDPDADWHVTVDGEDATLLEVSPPGLSSRYLPLPVLAITSTFLHGGFVHLAGNMLFLWVFGNAINYKLGHLGYAALYFFAALCSGLAQYAAAPLPLIGASGAIMGVVGAFLVCFPRNEVEMVLWVVWFKQTIGHLPSFWMILLWVVWDACFVVLQLPTNAGVFSHVTGFVCGFSIALILAATGLIRPTRYEQTLWDLIRSAF